MAEPTKPKKGKCEHCGKPNARYRRNPFTYEAHEEIFMQYICDDCHEELRLGV